MESLFLEILDKYGIVGLALVAVCYMGWKYINSQHDESKERITALEAKVEEQTTKFYEATVEFTNTVNSIKTEIGDKLDKLLDEKGDGGDEDGQEN